MNETDVVVELIRENALSIQILVPIFFCFYRALLLYARIICNTVGAYFLRRSKMFSSTKNLEFKSQK